MRKHTRHLLRAAVVFGAFAVIAWTQDLRSLAAGVFQIQILPVLAGIGLFLIGNCFVAARWKSLLSALDIHFPLISAIKVVFVGLFYNNIILSNIGGDLLRGLYVSKYTDKRLEAAFSVLADRLCGLAGCVVLAAGGFFLSREFFIGVDVSERAAERAQNGSTSFALTILIILAVAAAVLPIILVILKKMGRLEDVREKTLANLKRFIMAIMIYVKNPLAVLQAGIITLIAQSFTILGIYVASLSINPDVPLRIFFSFFPISWAIGALPISPGGLGVLELGIVALFAALPEVSNEQALMFALCQRIIMLGGAVPGFFIHLSGIHLPKQKSIEP